MQVTNLELKNLQLAADATAARTLMLWAAKLLLGSFPHQASLRADCVAAVQRKLSLTRADYLQMTFPEMSAAESELWAGEAQEAFDRLAKEFSDCIAKPAGA